MSDGIKKTIYYMWLVASVFIMVMVVFFGVMKSPDLRLAIGDVVLKACAPTWALLTIAVVIVMIAERMGKRAAMRIERY